MALKRIQQLFPNFDQSVAPGGYAWWYMDALSDDEQHGITVIGFIGSVFSPYYAWARQRGRDDPLQHCALNVALYGKPGRWAMTERSRKSVKQSASGLTIGGSSMSWDGNVIALSIDEIAVPLPARICGQVRVHPSAIGEQAFILNSEGAHRWWPIAPCARVEVELERPSLHWSGSGYFDANIGDAPLEQGFRRWSWSRARLSSGTAILYDMIQRSGDRLSFALHCHADGQLLEFEPPASVHLPSTRWWKISRESQADHGQVRVLQTLEDTPFYARSVLSTTLRGEQVSAVHESLSLDRFNTRWVQLLLPFRMPRIAY